MFKDCLFAFSSSRVVKEKINHSMHRNFLWQNCLFLSFSFDPHYKLLKNIARLCLNQIAQNFLTWFNTYHATKRYFCLLITNLEWELSWFLFANHDFNPDFWHINLPSITNRQQTWISKNKNTVFFVVNSSFEWHITIQKIPSSFWLKLIFMT